MTQPAANPPSFPDPLVPTEVVDSTDGVRLALHDLGGTGRPVLFVHATGFCAGVWRPLVERLGDDVHAYALDVRVHGCSTAPSGDMDWRGVGEDVLAAVDAFGLDRPLGVGHSMGGAGLLIAELQRPHTFAGLWLFEPIVFPTKLRSSSVSDAPNPMVEAALRRRPWFPSAEEAFRNFAAKPPLSELHPECLAAYVTDGFEAQADGTVALRCRPEWEAEVYRFGGRHDTFDHLDRVTCPVTVACGNRGLPGPVAIAPAIADALADGRLEEHPDLAHFGPLAGLDPVADRLRRWVTEIHASPESVGGDS